MRAARQLLNDLIYRDIISKTDHRSEIRIDNEKLTECDSHHIDLFKSEINTILRARSVIYTPNPIKLTHGPPALSFSQERMLELSRSGRLFKKIETHTIPLELWLTDASYEKVRGALIDILNKHKVLCYKLLYGGFGWRVGLNNPSEFHLNDVSTVNDIRTVLDQKIAAFKNSEIILDGGWLIKAALFNAKGNRKMLLLLLHHIVSDAMSASIIKRELRSLIEDVDNLPRANFEAISYTDYVGREREIAFGDYYIPLREYWIFWRKTVPFFTLPEVMANNSNGLGGLRNRYSYYLSGSALTILNNLCRENGITPAVFILTILSLALSQWNKQKQFAIQIIGNARTESNTIGMVGLMIQRDYFESLIDGSDKIVNLLKNNQDEMRFCAAARLPIYVGFECYDSVVFNYIPAFDTTEAHLVNKFFELAARIGSDDIPIPESQYLKKHYPINVDVRALKDSTRFWFDFNVTFIAPESEEYILLEFNRIWRSVMDALKNRADVEINSIIDI